MPNPFECFRNITKYKPYVFTNIKVTDNSVVNIYKLNLLVEILTGVL